MEENKLNENSEKKKRFVTILYYSEVSLELMHDVLLLPQNKNGRVIIPNDFKVDKSIVAVCDGEVVILNKVGDRV